MFEWSKYYRMWRDLTEDMDGVTAWCAEIVEKELFPLFFDRKSFTALTSGCHWRLSWKYWQYNLGRCLQPFSLFARGICFLILPSVALLVITTEWEFCMLTWHKQGQCGLSHFLLVSCIWNTAELINMKEIWGGEDELFMKTPSNSGLNQKQQAWHWMYLLSLTHWRCSFESAGFKTTVSCLQQQWATL